MKPKAIIMDQAALNRAITRITHEILERNGGTEGLCILGIKRRGLPIARMLCDNIKKFEGSSVPMGYIDITRHRDDMSEADKEAAAAESHVPCDINDKTVLIVDDVLYTGRTCRAAIECVFRLGRPRSLQLVALVDRGHRELPIRPDYVGKNVPTSKSETVRVRFDELDGETGVYICDVE